MYSKNINCPQCGNALPLNFRHSKLVVCDSCDSTIFLEDDAVHFAGEQSVLSEEPSLLQLKLPFTYQKQTYLPVGHVRYSYGRGFWDEWWVIDNGGEGTWVTVDEGDFAFEKPVKPPEKLAFDDLPLDKELNGWVVTERGQGSCEGFEGELPELINKGDMFNYVDLSKKGGKLLTLEFSDKGIKAYQGIWVDPFEIKAAA